MANYKIKAVTGTYTGKDGKTKKEWSDIGVCFAGDEGFFGTIKTTPLNWDGKFIIVESKSREEQPAPAPQKAQATKGEDRDELRLPF